MKTVTKFKTILLLLAVCVIGLASVANANLGDVYYTRSVAGGLISHVNSTLNDNYFDNGGGSGVFTGLSVDSLTGEVYSSSDRGGGIIDKFNAGLTYAGSVGVSAKDVTVNPDTGNLYSCRPNLIDKFTTSLGYVNSNYIGRNVTNIAVDTGSNFVFSIAPASSVSELSYIDKFSSTLGYLTSGVGYGIFRDIVVNSTTGYVYILRDTEGGNVVLDRFDNNLGYLNSNVLGTGTAWELATNSENGEVYAALDKDGGSILRLSSDLTSLGSSTDLGAITAMAINYNGDVLIGRTLNGGTLSRFGADLTLLSEIGNQGDINFIATVVPEPSTICLLAMGALSLRKKLTHR